MNKPLSEYLISNALEGIIVTDLEGTIIQVNATALEMLGFGRDELESAFVGTVLPPSSTYHLLSNLMKLAMDGTGFSGEIMFHNSQSLPVIVKLDLEVFPNPNAPQYLLFRFLEWTEVSDLLAELKAVNQMAVLGDLTRSISHEILNPVTAAGGFARKLIRSLNGDSNEFRWAEQILQNVEVLESLLGTVRNFVNIPQPDFIQEDVEKILNRALESTSRELKSREIRLERNHRNLERAYLDPLLMEKALTAVFVNAAERMSEGGILTVSGRSEGNFSYVEVDDTGPPLNPGQMEDDLSPLHVMRTLQSDLNLAIARKIIDDHGGKLVLSESDVGSLRVRISLPHDRRQVSRARLA